MNILETGDFSLYSSNKKKQQKLIDVWEDLQTEYEILKEDKTKSKTISISARIESILNKYKAINICCEVLRFTESKQAIEILKEHYFSIDENNYQSELERIENESKSYLIQVEKLKSQLPKQEENTSSKKTNFDEVILGYCAFVGVQLTPNKATVTEVIALEKLFLSKLKELEKPQKNGR